MKVVFLIAAIFPFVYFPQVRSITKTGVTAPHLDQFAKRSSPLYLREATVPLNNPARLPLGGYTRRLGKKDLPGGDTLYARVICLEQGSKRLVIESVEMLTIPRSLRVAVQNKLPKNVDLMLCATHTHCAPDSQMLNKRMTFAIPGIATFNLVQFDWYVRHIANAAIVALKSPAIKIEKIQTESWTAPCNRPRRKFAIPDQTACWIRFFTRNGKSTGIFWYSAHPTFYGSKELKTRGDWPGQVNRIAYLALIGPIGDVSPVAPRFLLTKKEADKLTPAEKINDFWKAMLEPVRSRKVRIRTVWMQNSSVQAEARGLAITHQAIVLKKPVPNPSFGKSYKIPQSLAGILVDKFAPIHASIIGFRIGTLAIIGVPGEPSSKLGRDIESQGYRDGFKTCLALSHCNNWIGYLLLPNDYRRGGYEANLNFYGANGGLRVCDAGYKALLELMKAP